MWVRGRMRWKVRKRAKARVGMKVRGRTKVGELNNFEDI
jgi:hypothetical protein